MEVVVLQILQWILRIILFLLLFLLIMLVVVLVVPIRYQAKGDFLEKKPGVRGKITWFFYLIYMSFAYEDTFHMQLRVFGIKVFDTKKKMIKSDSGQEQSEEILVEEGQIKENINVDGNTDCVLEDIHGHADAEIIDTAEHVLEEKNTNMIPADENLTNKDSQTDVQDEAEQIFAEDSVGIQKTENIQSYDFEEIDQIANDKKKEKKSFAQKMQELKLKVQELIQKIKDILNKIKEGKLKVEHYLELWNRKETQITFGRAKTKLGRMVKAILPGKWEITGEIGFDNPCTTGQLMGILGALYPIIGSRIKIVPNFENEIMQIQGRLKGHICLGNLLYQLVSLLLNRHCFKFIKLIFDELSGSKKSVKEI